MRDKTEIDRLGLPVLSVEYIRDILVPKYEAAGFELVETGSMDASEWSKLETSWARKLQGGEGRRVLFLMFEAT